MPWRRIINGSDHSVLPDIPFRNYEYMVKLAKSMDDTDHNPTQNAELYVDKLNFDLFLL